MVRFEFLSLCLLAELLGGGCTIMGEKSKPVTYADHEEDADEEDNGPSGMRKRMNRSPVQQPDAKWWHLQNLKDDRTKEIERNLGVDG
jgi:hypothetical protein